MNPLGRNAVLFVVVTLVWGFFFIPNPVLNFLNVQQLQAGLPNLVLFVLVPLTLALVSMLALSGTVSARTALTLCVPAVGVAVCLALWSLGTYSDESLLGAWLYALPPIVAYVVGVVIAILILRRRQMPASGSHTAS